MRTHRASTEPRRLASTYFYFYLLNLTQVYHNDNLWSSLLTHSHTRLEEEELESNRESVYSNIHTHTKLKQINIQKLLSSPQTVKAGETEFIFRKPVSWTALLLISRRCKIYQFAIQFCFLVLYKTTFSCNKLCR